MMFNRNHITLLDIENVLSSVALEALRAQFTEKIKIKTLNLRKTLFCCSIMDD